MTCIKTGAVVHFPEYGTTVPADLYAVDGVTIVRFLPEQWNYGDRSKATHIAYTREGFWRLDLGVLVASSLYGGVQEVES